MKKLLGIVVLWLVVCSTPSKTLEPFSAFNEKDPIINHLKLAMKDFDEFQYSLERCAGLLLAAGTAMHKFTEDKKAQESVDMGEDLMEYLAKFQIIKIQKKKLNNEIFNQVYRQNIAQVQTFNRAYYKRFAKNFKETGNLNEEDKFISDEFLYCLGFHEQLIGSN